MLFIILVIPLGKQQIFEIKNTHLKKKKENNGTY